MKEQDKRAVEGMARCGISLEGLIDAFSNFPVDEVTAIYNEIHKDNSSNDVMSMKLNCS